MYDTKINLRNSPKKCVNIKKEAYPYTSEEPPENTAKDAINTLANLSPKSLTVILIYPMMKHNFNINVLHKNWCLEMLNLLHYQNKCGIIESLIVPQPLTLIYCCKRKLNC